MKTFREVILEFNKWRDAPFKRKNTIGSYLRVIPQQPTFEYYMINDDEGNSIEYKGQIFFTIDEVFNYWLCKVFYPEPFHIDFDNEEEYKIKRTEFEEYLTNYLI